MIIRIKSGASFDPSIGRFLFFPLDGPVIKDKLIRRHIDHNLFPSLKQFVLVLSFIENVIFTFDTDAAELMIDWGNCFKHQSLILDEKICPCGLFLGYDERNTNECLSARLGKSVQYAYRIAAFLQTLEIAFEICQLYLQDYHCFPHDGAVNQEFLDKISDLYRFNYSNQFLSHDPFPISKDVTLRAIDVITGNIHQFQLLFDTTNAPRLSAIGRQLIVVAGDPQQSTTNIDDKQKNKNKLKSKPCFYIHLMKQNIVLKFPIEKQRNDFNFNRVAAEIILYPSVCFTLKQLHKNNQLHNSGGIKLKDVTKKLLDADILTVCPRGIKCTSKQVPVFIKQLPLDDEINDENYLVSALSEYTVNDNPISLTAYKNSCNSFSLLANGTIHSDVYQILSRQEYRSRDFYRSLYPENSIAGQTSFSTNDNNHNDGKQLYFILSLCRYLYNFRCFSYNWWK